MGIEYFFGVKFLLILFPLSLLGLTWEEFEAPKEERAGALQLFFAIARRETLSPPAALILLDCYCLPSSIAEVEFAILLPERANPELYSSLFERFLELSREHGLDLGEQVAPLFLSRSSFDPLCFPSFGGGDWFLFQRFFELVYFPAPFPSDWIDRVKKSQRNLLKGKEERLFRLRDIWLCPAIELVRRLSLQNGVFARSLGGALSLLLLAEVITEREKICLDRFFLLSFDLIERYGAAFSAALLTKAERESIAASLPCLLNLSVIYRENAM
jgi:hypothetical protein